MSLRGYALQEEFDTEIVSAYAASQADVPGVVSAPGWYTIAEFFLGKTVKTRLEVIGFVSAGGLVATCRLYDPTAGTDAPVSGSDVSFSALVSDRYQSGAIELAGNRRYMIQCQCVGAVGIDKFATVQNGCLGSV